MSDPRIAAISAELGGTPESIVERSAEARATAQGVSLDEVLSAWSGGGELAAAAPPADAPAEAPAAESAEPAAAPSEPVAAAPAASAVVTAPPPMIEPEPEIEPIDPAPLGARVVLGARIGALLGGLLGVVALIVAMPLVIGRLGLPAGEGVPAVEVTPVAALLTIAGLSAAFGVVITLAARGVSALLSPAYATGGTARSGTMLGLLNGAVLGFIAGGIVIGMAESTVSATRLLPTRSLVFTVLIGGVLLGAVAGALAQAMAQPAALHGEAADDAGVVQKRLLDSMAIPLVSGVIVLVIVVSLGMLLVQFPSFAPVVAILVAIGILAFASLMASRPNLRISRGEVLAAAAGVGVVLLMIALIASHVAGDDHHGEEESHSAPITILG